MPDSAEPLTRVQSRIEDAGVLADSGRFEGALLMLLVAVAATSRKRYPRGTASKRDPSKEMGDGEAFKSLLRDEMWRLTKGATDVVVFRDKPRSLEDFLYTFLRNELIHEGGIPVDLQPIQEGAVLTVLAPDGTGISFTRLFLSRLNDVVWRAPENSFQSAQSELAAIAQRSAKRP